MKYVKLFENYGKYDYEPSREELSQMRDDSFLQSILSLDAESIALSLDHGFDINNYIEDRGGYYTWYKGFATPLHYAISVNANPEKEMDRMKTIDVLISSGLPLDAQDKDGMTPLHIAVMQNDLGTVEALLDSGADSTIENNDGMLPLDLASTRRMKELLMGGIERDGDFY